MLDGLEASFAAGQVTGLFGPSGSGKSTLIRAIARVQARVRGTLTVLGESFDQAGAPLLAFSPLTTVFLVTSISLLRERTTGTLERLPTTPLGRSCSARGRFAAHLLNPADAPFAWSSHRRGALAPVTVADRLLPCHERERVRVERIRELACDV